MTETTLRVPAIHCETCVRRIVDALERVPGIAEATGDKAARTIRVVYEPDRETLARILQAVTGLGFEVGAVLAQPDGGGGLVALGVAEPAEAHTNRTAVRRFVIVTVVAGSALAMVGYLAGFLGYAYDLAAPGAFDRLSVALVAVFSGLAAFFSPCVFPLLPAYVAYQAAAAREGSRRRLLATAAGAVAGLTLANLVLGAIIALLGSAAPFQPDPRQDTPAILAVRFLAGVSIVGLGLAALRGRSLGSAIVSLATRVAGGSASGRGATETFLFGLTYNAAGIGCTGPILLALLVFAISSGQAALAFVFFAVTMGGLMFTVTLLASLLGRTGMGRLAAASERFQRIGAVILILAGTYTMVSLSFGAGRELFVRIFLPFLP